MLGRAETGANLAQTLISVVDDDQSVRDSIESVLRSVGHKVATFPSGESFLQSDLVADTGLLILDMRMPGIDGLEVQRRMLRLETVVPIIFVTALGDRFLRQHALDVGAHGFFQKPYMLSKFLSSVQTALKKTPAAVGGR